jgi:hypothetical protein
MIVSCEVGIMATVPHQHPFINKENKRKKVLLFPAHWENSFCILNSALYIEEPVPLSHLLKNHRKHGRNPW